MRRRTLCIRGSGWLNHGDNVEVVVADRDARVLVDAVVNLRKRVLEFILRLLNLQRWNTEDSDVGFESF